MLTNQKQIRALFWDSFPNLPRRRYRYSLRRDDKAAPLVYPVEKRLDQDNRRQACRPPNRGL